MKLYAILRRGGWSSGAELEEAAERSRRVGDEEMAGEVRWIRSYVLAESTGVGTICIYEAVDAEAVRRHARAARLPATEVIPVVETVVVRPDPVAA